MKLNKKVFFVTSTGTNLGKTFISQNLLKSFKKNDIAISAYKPIISGVDKNNIFKSDSALLLKETTSEITIDDIKRISPWRFKKPLAPTLAARKERKVLDYSSVKNWLKKKIQQNIDDFILVEGAGGLMVPIGEKKTFIDLVVDIKMPILLVVGNYLGSISHSLSIIKNIEILDLDIINIILNDNVKNNLDINETELLLKENIKSNYKIRKIYKKNKPKNIKSFTYIYEDIIKYFK